MSSKTLIAIVGLPASGKSTAIESIKEFGPIIIMGDVIREESIRQSKDPGLIAQELRDKHGNDVVALRCIEKIKLLKESVVFIDGIRSDSEIDRFREHWPLYVIAIVCPNDLRFDRIINRGQSDDTKDIEKIRERDQRELEFGLGIVIESADYIIQNSLDIETLQKKVKNLVRGLL